MDIQDLSSKINTLETMILTLQKNYNKLNINVSNISHSLETNIHTNKQDKANLNKTSLITNNHINSINNLNDNVSSHDISIKNISNHLDILNNQVNKLQISNSKLKNNSNNINLKLASLSSQLNSISQLILENSDIKSKQLVLENAIKKHTANHVMAKHTENQLLANIKTINSNVHNLYSKVCKNNITGILNSARSTENAGSFDSGGIGTNSMTGGNQYTPLYNNISSYSDDTRDLNGPSDPNNSSDPSDPNNSRDPNNPSDPKNDSSANVKIDYKDPFIGWWYYPYGKLGDVDPQANVSGPDIIAKNMGFNPYAINTVFNLASGNLPGNQTPRGPGEIDCGRQQGDGTKLLLPLPPSIDPQKFAYKVLNFGGWGSNDFIPMKWNKSMVDLLKKNVEGINEYCKQYHYNLVSFDIEGIDTSINTSDDINSLCKIFKDSGLGVILTIPGFGVGNDNGGNGWFEKLDPNNVDKVCFMFYDRDSDTESRNYTPDVVLNKSGNNRNLILPRVQTYPAEKLILGVSCATGNCGGLVTDQSIKNLFKGGLSVWKKTSLLTANWNETPICPKNLVN